MENRRTLPKIVVNSCAQFRTAIPFFVLLAIACLTFIFAFSEIGSSITPDVGSRLMLSGMIGLSVMGVVSLVLWLIYSHRIFGPIVPIRRHIDRLCAGDYDTPLSLRKYDEFHDVAEDLNRLTKVLKNQRGQSLVQLIVAIGIMGILMLAMASMFSLQAKESRALTEKLAAADLYRNLSMTLGNGAACFDQLASGNLLHADALSFDPTTVSVSSPHNIELRTISGAGSGPELISLGSAASAMSSTLKVAAASGIELSVTSATTGKLLINFDQASLVRPIHNLVLPVTIQSSGSSTSMTVTGCGGSGGAANAGGSTLVFGNVASPSSTTSVMCPSSTHLIYCTVRSYSVGDGQGYPELQQVTYLDATGAETGTYENVPGGRAPASSIVNPQGCSYFNVDHQDRAQVTATCM